MGAFKRHIVPEHGVDNKCMFDYDQLISRLKDKGVSNDVLFQFFKQQNNFDQQKKYFSYN